MEQQDPVSEEKVDEMLIESANIEYDEDDHGGEPAIPEYTVPRESMELPMFGYIDESAKPSRPNSLSERKESVKEQLTGAGRQKNIG